MKKLFLALSIAAIASLAFAQPFVWPDAWSADAGKAKMGGTLRVAQLSDPRTFNPFVSAEAAPVILRYADNLGAALITRGPDSDDWIPYAAKSFTISEDGKTVDVVLRDGIKWSDGTPVTIKDYLFRYEAETDEDVGANAYDGWFIKGEPIILEATGDNSLRFTFPEPDRTALPIVAMVPSPDHILGEIYRSGGAEALKAEWGIESDVSKTVWTGPFIPTGFTPGERATLVKNPYFGEWNVDEAGNPLPYLDGIVENIVGDGDAGLNLFLAGELDTYGPRNLDDIGLINVAIQNGDIDAIVMENVAPVASSQFIVFNWNKEDDPFKQKLFRSATFRQAMSHLVDREAMVELIYGGSASPMWSNVYQVNSYWVNNDVPKFPFDPEAAAAKLASIGFTEKNSDGFLVDADGNELAFTLATNSGNKQREQILDIFTDAARDIGVNVDAKAIEFSSIVDQLLSEGTNRPFDAILIGLSGGSRDWPFGSNVIPCGTNLHMYNTSGDCIAPQELLMTKLYYQGRSTLDTPAAREIGMKLQEVQAQIQPQIYTVSPAAHYSWLSNVGGQHVDGQINPIVGAREIPLTFKK